MAEGVPGIGSSENANPIGSYDFTGGRTQTVQDLSGAATPGMKRAAQMMSEITPPRSAPGVDFKSVSQEPFIPQVLEETALENLPIGGAAFKENLTTLPEMDLIDSSLPRNTSNTENLILNPDGGYNLYDDGSEDYKYNLAVGPLPGTARTMATDAQGFRIPGGVRRSPYFASKRSQDVRDIMIPFDEAIEEEFMYDRGGMHPKSSDEEVDALKAMLNMVSTIKKEVSPSDLEEEVRETPGEFDHDDNPIDIVQGEEKIGEMTGGEYIFNPEQAEMLKQLSNEGDSELHEFIRNLLSKEQFNG